MNLLVIGHEASANGATTTLLNLIKQLKKEGNGFSFAFIFNEGGSVADEFKKLGPCLFLHQVNPPLPFFRLQRFRKKKMIRWAQRQQPFDLIFANTVATIDHALRLKSKLNIQTWLYVHEMRVMIQQIWGKRQLPLHKVDYWLTASDKVTSVLNKNYSVSREKIYTFYECVEFPEAKTALDGRDIIIGGSGFVHWRKSPDLFLQVAHKIHKRQSDIKFEWIGGVDSLKKPILENELDKLGLQDVFTWHGHIAEPHDIVANWHLFLLVSREDPFPLAALEAMDAGVPVLLWKDSTGIEEISPEEMMVPYLDIDSMAEKALRLCSMDALSRKAMIPDVSNYLPEKKGAELMELFKKL